MLKIKIQGLEIIEFNTKLEVNGSIPGYTVEHQELEGKLCETSTIIYPTAQYERNENKFSAICTELSCNADKVVAFDSSDQLIEYIDVNGELFTVKALYESYKDNSKILYGCDYTGVKATKEQLRNIVKCDVPFGCDFCMATQGSFYAFDLDGNKVQLEAFGEDAGDFDDMEFRIYIVTPELMKEIEKAE